METAQKDHDFFAAWKFLPEDFRASLNEILADQHNIAAKDRIMVAPCPNCGSTNTRDCGNTEINDPTVGFCMDCGCMGCLICGAVFDDGETQCPHWAICRKCSEPKDERGHCGIPLWECPAIQAWKAKRQHQFEF